MQKQKEEKQKSGEGEAETNTKYNKVMVKRTRKFIERQPHRNSEASLLHRAVRRCELSVVQELLVREDRSWIKKCGNVGGREEFWKDLRVWEKQNITRFLWAGHLVQDFTRVNARDRAGHTALHTAHLV